MEAESVSDMITTLHAWRDQLSAMPPAKTEHEAVERITALEELTSASAAVQARDSLTFDMLRRNREAADGVPSFRQGRGLGSEIALARKVSRARGAKLLAFSRTLLMDLPNTYDALKNGRISEEKAKVVAKETSWLPREKRWEADARMAERLDEVGVGRLGNEVRALAQRLDQKAAVEHLDRCVDERSVSVRPAPGNMAYLTALLPLKQAVATYANLSKSAQSQISLGQADGRSQSQIMADLLVERATGQDGADAIPTEVHLVMNENSLFGSGEMPAWFPGFGPIPAKEARRFVSENEAAVFLRRLYTRPSDGQLVQMDSRRREFSGLLRRMVVIRDDVCRSPWCNAQIKHADHAESVATGGTTTWANASGLCAACNYAKELTGWRHEATPESLTVTTPTGHRYTTTTKPIGESAPPDQMPTTIRSTGSPRREENLKPELSGPPEIGPPAIGPPASGSPTRRPKWTTLEHTVVIPPMVKKTIAPLHVGGRTIGVDQWVPRPPSSSEIERCCQRRLLEVT